MKLDRGQSFGSDGVRMAFGQQARSPATSQLVLRRGLCGLRSVAPPLVVKKPIDDPPMLKAADRRHPGSE